MRKSAANVRKTALSLALPVTTCSAYIVSGTSMAEHGYLIEGTVYRMSDSDLQSDNYLAHLDDTGRCQMLSEHLASVSEITSRFSAKIGLGMPGALIGLLHDLGKYSNAFQQYLRLMSRDQDTEPCHMERGSVDHSTAGAQTIWRNLAPKGKVESVAAQIFALCIASHHSGLIDCVDPDGTDRFSRRMLKVDSESHYDEARSRAERLVIERSRKLLDDPNLVSCVQQIILKLCQNDQNETIRRYMIGLLARFLFSCLIDADRTDTADFTNPSSATLRQHGRYDGWHALADRLERSLKEFPCKNNVDELRRQVAARCVDASDRSREFLRSRFPRAEEKRWQVSALP